MSYNSFPSGFIVVEGVSFSHTMFGLLGLSIPMVFLNIEALIADAKAGQAVLIADGVPVNLLTSVRHVTAAN